MTQIKLDENKKAIVNKGQRMVNCYTKKKLGKELMKMYRNGKTLKM